MALTRFSVPPLHSVTRNLAAVAQGKLAPDFIITGARILSTYSERFFSDRQIWIKDGRIAAVKPLSATPFSADVPRYDALGGILAPGLIDAHLHIESSMVSACAYAEGALLNGTTTIFCDSHEIGNVLGQDGIAMMLEDARQAPLSIFLTVPSTIPATHSGLETAGGDLTPERVGALFDAWPEAVALGEKMDFIAVCEGDERSHALIAAALKRGRPVCGHLYGRDLVAAYAASGVTDTHEAIDPDIANDLVEAGIWVFLRGGPPHSPWNSLPAAIRAITQFGAHPKRFCLCTDDRDADDLMLFGLDYVAQCAIRNGLAPATAWSLGSLHAAQRYAMDGEIGALGSGRRADMVLLNDDMAVQNTWYGGELLVENKKITTKLELALGNRYSYPKRALQTVTLPQGELSLLPELPPLAQKVHVIGAVPGAITTAHEVHEILPNETMEQLTSRLGLLYIAVLERHGINGNIGRGFLRHFGMTQGAVASSVGHDAHNLIVAGSHLADMQLAIKTLHIHQGGVVVVLNGEVTALVELPVAGLLSQERLPVVAEKMNHLKQVWKEMGCTLPYMGFNLLPLSVIPAFRLTDCGLVDVTTVTQVPLFEPA